MQVDEPGQPYSDDADLADDTVLLRRIRPDWVLWDETGIAGQWPRITSQNFQDYSEDMAARIGCPAPAMSVGLFAVLESHGKDESELLVGYAGYGVAAITAANVRLENQGVTPWATETEPWHALVFSRTARTKSVGTRSRLAGLATWRVRPTRP